MPSGGAPASRLFHCWSDRSAAACGTWRRWAAATGRSVVVANRNLFPHAEWVRSVAEQIDLPAAAVHCLAQRAECDPDEFLAAWRAKTPADCERFWNTLAPNADDDLLRAVANLAVGRGSPSTVAASLSDLGERIVPMIARLAPIGQLAGCLVRRWLDRRLLIRRPCGREMGHASAGRADCGRGARRSVGRIPSPPLRTREPKHF